MEEEERSKANVITPGCISETAAWEENKEELPLLLGHKDNGEILMVVIFPFFLKTITIFLSYSFIITEKL